MISKDFFQALEELEATKNIKAEQLIESLELALTSAYKKMYGEAKSAEVKINSEKCSIKIYSYKTVVEEVENPDKEICLEDAKEIKNSYKIGDTIIAEEDTKKFGRVAALTAKQVVMQKIQEIEKQAILETLSEREDQLITGIVKRMDQNIVYVQIADSNTEGVMMENDQIRGEKYTIGQRLKVYVKKIKEGARGGVQVQVSRTNNGFLRKLFELEIPEVESGDVEIVNIARDSGNRSKVAIRSNKEHIDAMGACVGNRGNRINTISNEINGERIDLVMYSDDPLEYIAAALSPAPILSVEVNESLKASRVIVPDDKLSVAIGKAGQNVRLAARLTGWKIDVKCQSDFDDEEAEDNNYSIEELEDNDIFADLGDIEELEEIESIDDVELGE